MSRTIKKTTAVLLVLMVLVTVFASVADAAYDPPDGVEYMVIKPRMFIVGSTATCSTKITAEGQYIDATLELNKGVQS